MRQFPRPIRRVVVKLGSSVIATYQLTPQSARLRSLVEQISALQHKDVEVVLVSSGAIVLGMGEMKVTERPKDLASLQALAAVGQAVLMRTYGELFKKKDITCAQLLLTWDDFDARERYINARHTIQAILKDQVIPIINENDTIATDEIKFGDNDRLSALVACLIHADLLVILSDVEGLYDMKNGERKVFQEIKEITKDIEGIATGTGKPQMSKGGMSAKLEAIKMATQANIPCVIAKGETENVLTRIIAGERIGTFFVEKEEKQLARKHWISFGAKPKGKIVVDAGAKTALLKGGRSLLLPGVLRWEGHFKVDDVVTLCDEQDQEIARGISNYSIADLNKVSDKRGQREVVHCDNLVLNNR
jgi:glutamate 5-kinase